MQLDFSNLEGFEWDKGNLGYIKKHQITKEQCEEVFLNRPLVITNDITHSQKEERFRVLGKTNEEKLISLIITIREDKIRMVSARNQSKKEKKNIKKMEVKINEKIKNYSKV